MLTGSLFPSIGVYHRKEKERNRVVEGKFENSVQYHLNLSPKFAAWIFFAKKEVAASESIWDRNDWKQFFYVEEGEKRRDGREKRGIGRWCKAIKNAPLFSFMWKRSENSHPFKHHAPFLNDASSGLHYFFPLHPFHFQSSFSWWKRKRRIQEYVFVHTAFNQSFVTQQPLDSIHCLLYCLSIFSRLAMRTFPISRKILNSGIHCIPTQPSCAHLFTL